MKTHELKIQPKYLVAVKSGLKKFELRINDRLYEVGDYLKLRSFFDGEYQGSEHTTRIIYILHDDCDGIEEGYCILGIR